MTNNKTVLKWLDEVKELVSPDKVVWIDGSEEQLEGIRKEAVESGEMIKLNEEKLPGCYLHRTRPNDVARVEDRTFICSKTKENAGPTNNWCDPQEMYDRLYNIARGSYKGRTMYIIPFSMGPIGSPLAKVGIEVTGIGAGLDGILDCMARFGRVALLGCTRNKDFTIDYYRKVHGPGITLVGAHTQARPQYESSDGWWTQRDDIATTLKLTEMGRIKLSDMIDEIHSPAQAPEVYTRLANEKSFPMVQFDWRKL